MLEKSGWTEGKGLGLKENGDKEAIAMKLKQDNTGSTLLIIACTVLIKFR